MSLLLAIDQSTSATKAILFDQHGRIRDKSFRNHQQIYPQPTWVEHDAEEIWQNVLAVIQDLATRQDLSSVLGISLANQRETFVVFDRQTSAPLHPAIVWQCLRGDALCQNLRRQGLDKFVKHKTGLKIDTYFSASKIAWILQNKPDIAARVNEGSALIGTIDTYLIHRLTQGQVFATDPTNASRTLLFNIQNLSWDKELCEWFDVPLHALAEIRESASHFGETNANGLLPRKAPIMGVMGDSQASLFAQQCFAPGSIKATFGTGTSILLNLGNQFHLAGQGTMTALAWVSRGQPTYALEGLINYSAATLSWLKNNLGLFSKDEEIEALATSVKDHSGVYIVPAFSGLNAPYWAPEARAAIIGLSAFSKREHLIRAGVESIAYQIRDVLDMMRSEVNIPLKTLHADGGPTRNTFLMQFTADLNDLELKVAQIAESSAWGAALNGWLALGVLDSPDAISQLPQETRTYFPEKNREPINILYQGWLDAVNRIL